MTCYSTDNNDVLFTNSIWYFKMTCYFTDNNDVSFTDNKTCYLQIMPGIS